MPTGSPSTLLGLLSPGDGVRWELMVKSFLTLHQPLRP